MIQRLDHVNIVVSDLDKASEFFSLLGFKAGAKSPLSGTWISEIVGLENVDAEYIVLSHPGSKVNIELIHYNFPNSTKSADISKANQIGIRHLAFAVVDIEEQVDKLLAAGIKFMSEVKTYPATGKKLVYFKGPDDILL